ncbi:glycosyltransferase family 2 protein [Ohtaekwangia koreensis]|uniref:Glycosyltransferase 2-like domain-containing protein n=1 Tax=Ohtaekwangia koreensis TaxID=688867 RepID=A0A1T5LMP3_9BACT|nr:glycosyltransferase family 2 protein [Ohtaekwangia koreensis]SKC77232.1 hypothetical protein SAMN05660236_3542 [Ohtaekwangia koreensis]
MISSSPQVSVVIINYNTFELTCGCIQSVVEKTSGCTYEIIVVDNASTEGRVKEFLVRFPFITLIESKVNVGFSKGNNIGIEQAKGEFILLLNSDTELQNDALSICQDFIKKDKKAAAVSALLKYPDGAIQHNCQRFPSIKYKLFELFRLQKFVPRRIGGRVLLGFFFDYNEVVYPDWIWGTFFMFRRESLKLLPQGKLADDFFMYVEDMQWCMEFRNLGYSIAFQPAAQVVHYMGKSGGAKSELIDQNIDRFMSKYYSPFERLCIRWLDRILL